MRREGRPRRLGPSFSAYSCPLSLVWKDFIRSLRVTFRGGKAAIVSILEDDKNRPERSRPKWVKKEKVKERIIPDNLEKTQLTFSL